MFFKLTFAKKPTKTTLRFYGVLSGKNDYHASDNGHFIEHFSLPYFAPKDTISEI
jgi:hypothetical protein